MSRSFETFYAHLWDHIEMCAVDKYLKRMNMRISDKTAIIEAGLLLGYGWRGNYMYGWCSGECDFY